ncbi:protein kinase domain-containing protein [Actinomycetospora atypica]|uniref:Protein kinase n=1 Tax=Actinomycetospora atypica TaxID=1290095 RepID=A0ABV9YWT2_9PSEU
MERIGRYELLSLIGRGGMGEVWRAHDAGRGRDVALKLLPTTLSENSEYQRRFRRESHLVARLREPHLIPIHDHGEIDGRLFLDMRLVEGRSLHEVLRDEGPLPVRRAVALLGQVADALDAAHADGLVHRDVKPSNVLVTPNDFVYVVDFGLAYAVDTPRTRLTMTGVTLGTLEYMAPERFSNRPVDGRTDVYSLACMLFECLTRDTPFPGDFPTQMFGHLNVDPPRCSERSPGVPVALDAVVARGMAKVPGDRFATAGDLVAAAREALRGAPRETASRPAVVSPAVVSPAGAAVDGAAAATALVSLPPVATARPSGNGSVALASPAVARPAEGPVPHPSGPLDFSDPARPAPGAPPPEFRRPGSRRPRRGVVWAAAGVLVLAAVVALVVTTVPLAGSPAPAPVAGSATPTVVGTVPVGASPVAVQVAPDGRFAYVADRDAGVLTVVDTATDTATGTIPVPDGGPQAVAFSPDGRHAYVGIARGAGGEVGVVDTAAGAVTATIPTRSAPMMLVVSPDGRRVHASETGSIAVIDTDTNAVVDRVEGVRPHGLALSPDGTLLAVAEYDADVVRILGAVDGRPVATIPVGRSPHAVAWHRTAPRVLVTDYAGDSVSVIDPSSARVVATVPTAVHPQAVTTSADGRHAYVAAIDASVVQVLDTTTSAVTATVPTGRGPSSVAVTPDGRKAYVTDLLDGTMTVLNVAEA